MIKLYDVTVEYQSNPIGLPLKNPRFFWKLVGKQCAYRINVSVGKDTVWDSGIVESPETVGINYCGKQLVSRTIYSYKITIYGKKDDTATYEGNFETTLRDDEWLGNWMSMPVNFTGGTSLYRKKFTLPNAKLIKARAYVCGLGFHEFFFNGLKVGDAVLNPSVTDYSKRLPYVVYNLDDMVVVGENACGIELGHGWYGSKVAFAQLYFDYENNETIEIHSSVNGGWWVGGSPTISNSIYGGEVYDARIEERYPKDWSKASFEPLWEKGWMFTIYAHAPNGKLEPQLIEPVRITEKYPAKLINDFGNGVKIYDFGSNIAGWARIKVKGKRGSSITLKFAERLAENGRVNRLNLRSAGASDTYILNGNGIEEYAPRFTYHGFQYAETEIIGEVEIISVVGEHVHTDTAITGNFSCSLDSLNTLHNIAALTEHNNQHGILTDCPQRDERFGWLNDLGARLFQTVYNCDMSRFFKKFTADITDTQLSNGEIGDTVPYYTGGRPADPVCVAYLRMPVLAYRLYGDRSIATEQYAGLKKWTDYLLSRSKNFIMDYYYYADWVCPDMSVRADNIYVSTLSLLWTMKLMVKIAEIVGNDKDREYYDSKVKLAVAAINEKYFDATKCTYSLGTQTENALALSLGIVDEKYRNKVAKQIADDVIARGYHCTSGNVGYRHVFYALGDYGYTDVALKMLLNPEYPGWGFMLKQGATSVWERWEKEMSSEMDSFDHPMFGSYDAFLYAYLGGIKVDDDAFGSDKITIAPKIAKDLDYVKTSLDTIRGKITCEWQKTENGTVKYFITAPDGVKVKAILNEIEFNVDKILEKEL